MTLRMKHSILASALLVLAAGCQSGPPPVFTTLPRELFVAYAKAGDTLRVVRLLETGGQAELHRATLVEGRVMTQRAAPTRKVPADSLLVLQALLRARYQWRPFAGSAAEELFVQVDPDLERREETLLNIMAVLNERQSLESDLGEALASQHLGEWAAGDLGAGGMNMLFDVNSPATALPVLMQVLQTHRVQGRTRIARRLMTAADDWRYEVIYPLGFSGVFNSL
jgi:hypothetical protein